MSKRNTHVAQSFKYALNGLVYAFRYERNMRIHTLIAVLILCFAYVYGISRAEWAILVLTCFFTVICEMINTAIEYCVDTATTQYNEYAKLAKDVAAGAVFMSAIVAIVVGITLFGNVEKIISTLKTVFTDPFYAITFFVLTFAGLLFIFKLKPEDWEEKKH